MDHLCQLNRGFFDGADFRVIVVTHEELAIADEADGACVLRLYFELYLIWEGPLSETAVGAG
jgi:hypothetical protein